VYPFVTKGIENTLKIVEYSFVKKIFNQLIFNLGFGNYDPLWGRIDDETVSNNGDVYRVFNTVLSTIEAFLTAYPKIIISICGSDSTEEFVLRCKLNCDKRCDSYCKKKDRRINMYCKYLDRNLEQFSSAYEFWGDPEVKESFLNVEPYQPGKKYMKIFIGKKQN
jgi:hypothetical protein